MLHTQATNNATIAQNPDMLETLLMGLTDPRKVAQATQTLTSFLEDKQSCLPLLKRLHESKNPQVRQLAATYLRSKVAGYSKELSKEEINVIKQVLTQCLGSEKEKVVLRAVGQLVIKVGRTFSWHDKLLQILMEMIQKGNQLQIEIGITAMRNMVEITNGVPFEPYVSVFSMGLKQKNETVVVESLKGLKQIAETTQGDPKKIQALLPQYQQMAQCCQQLVQHPDESISRYVVDMWHDLFVDGCLTGMESEMYKFMLKVGAERNLQINVRYMCVEYLKSYAKLLPNRIIKDQLLTPCMEMCIGLLMEDWTTQTDDDISAPMTMAIEIMDSVFLNVRVDETVNLALTGFQKLVETNNLKPALALLAIMVEGCQEMMREDKLLEKIYRVLIQGMSHSNNATRKVAYEALTQFVYHLSPTMNKYAPELMPKLFQCLQQEMNCSDNVETVCIAMDSYISVLEEAFKPFLTQTLQVLFNLLNNGSNEVKEAAVSALSSVLLTTRESKINMDVQVVTELIKMLITIIGRCQTEEVMKLRAEATMCIGEVCLTIGPKQTVLLDQQTQFIDKIIEGTQIDSSDLKEYTYGFFGTLAQLFKEELLQHSRFPIIFKLCCDALESEDGLTQAPEDDGFGGPNQPEMAEEEEVEEGEEDLLTQYRFYVATGFLEEKTAAAMAFEKFAGHLGPGYQRYWDEALPRIIDCLSYPHPHLKAQVTRAIHQHMKLIMHTIINNQCASPKIQQTGEEYLNMAVTLYLVGLIREEDKECAVEIIRSLAELCKIDAQAIIGLKGRDPDVCLDTKGRPDSSWIEFIEIAESLFGEKLPCQTPDDVELEKAKRETEDNAILDALTDLTSSLSQGLTELQLHKFWKCVFPSLGLYLRQNRSHIEYSLAIGCMGDVSAKLSPASIAPFLNDSVAMAFQGLTASNHYLVRQNSVYALGCLCRAGQNSMQPFLDKILSFLVPLCQLPRGQQKKYERLIRDNAYSSLGSLLAFVPVPQDKFRQLFELYLKGVPIEDDYLENKVVAGALLSLLQNKQNLVQPYLPQIQQLLQHSLGWKEMPPNLVAQIRSVLGSAI